MLRKISSLKLQRRPRRERKLESQHLLDKLIRTTRLSLLSFSEY